MTVLKNTNNVDPKATQWKQQTQFTHKKKLTSASFHIVFKNGQRDKKNPFGLPSFQPGRVKSNKAFIILISVLFRVTSDGFVLVLKGPKKQEKLNLLPSLNELTIPLKTLVNS